MMTVEQPKFIELVSESLAAYTKAPTAADIEAWWVTCKRFEFSDVERALREHAMNEEDGKRAPRPIDVKRRLEFGTQESEGCSASGVAGKCTYPGIFSESTSGGDRWWCPWHRTDHAGPEAERWIEVSQRVPYATALAKRAERMLDEGKATRAVFDTAHAIALRHGNRPWQAKDPNFIPAAEAQKIVSEDAEEAA